ncbi:hypothetical protein PsB1_0440 [Candidatus Phycosocius spiralis]|uniref:TIGR02444 family protein n=2 Tax=Candidatus Phycosocius spiralis TaxID=2815099 RepID=A0ABQ4PTI6_9PROT|nr:hypothetical protein PsB1_0440 [Candidatus Phycosocius spiralis]
MDNIWDFALAIYQQNGVKADCLVAQDVYGLDVTMLIFALYRSRHGLGFDAPASYELARQLTRMLVDPLRARRRALKSTPAGHDPRTIAQLRDQIEAAELAGEHTILQTLIKSDIKGPKRNGYDSLCACVVAANISLDLDLEALLKRLALAGQKI